MPKIISIIGFPRSGTTWLGRVLSQLEGIQYIEEPIGTWYRAFRHGQSDISISIRENESAYKWISRNWNKKSSVIIEKTPTNILRVRHLREFIPNIKLICLLRDPLEVSTSMVDKWKRAVDRNHTRLSGPTEQIGSSRHTLKARIRKAAQIGRFDAMWEQREKAWTALISFLRARPVPLEHAIRIPGIAEMRSRFSDHDLALWGWIFAHKLLLADINNITKEDRVFVEYQELKNREHIAWRHIMEILGVPLNGLEKLDMYDDAQNNSDRQCIDKFNKSLVKQAYYIYEELYSIDKN